MGIPQATGHIDSRVLVWAAGARSLLPVIPFALEMLALRHMTPTAFGTLMALEPAFSGLLGLPCSSRTHRRRSTQESHSWCWPGLRPNAADAATGGAKNAPVRTQSWDLIG